MVPMTAAQRASLARLRVYHPRASVTVPHRNHQKSRPYIRVKMRWSKTTVIRWVWLAPDGHRYFAKELPV